ncbi:MAG: tetratricopeptide repeat protein [Candidatus Hodarchaeales archaeon]
MQELLPLIISFLREGRYQDLVTLLETEIASKNHTIEENNTLSMFLAEAYYETREFKKAKNIAENLLKQPENSEQYKIAGNAENLLGKIYRIHRRYEDALTHYKRAEEIFTSIKDDEGLSKIYNNTANVYIFMENFKEARKYHDKSLEIAKKLGKRNSIANSYLNIGSMYYHNGEVDLALENFIKAKDILQEINDVPNLASVNINIAGIYYTRKEHDKAIQMSQEAVSLLENQQDIMGKIVALTTLARALKESKNYQKAIETYLRIKEISETVSEETYMELGECYIFNNQINKAIAIYEEVIRLNNVSSRGTVLALDNLARIFMGMKDFSKSLVYYQQLMDILEKIKPRDDDSIAATKANAAFVLTKLGEENRAMDFFKQAIKYFDKKKYYDDILVTVNNFKDELVLQNNYTGAIKMILDYKIPAVKKSGNKMMLDDCYFEIAFLHHLEGDSGKGIDYLKKKVKKAIFTPVETLSFFHHPDMSEDARKKLEKSQEEFQTSLKQ